jgi:hypothetical protein
MKMKPKDPFSWHDGRLGEVIFSCDAKGKSQVVISALLYRDEHARVRDSYRIVCSGVLRYSGQVDAVELKANMSAGNISNGYVKEKTLWIYLADRMLEVEAGKFQFIKG